MNKIRRNKIINEINSIEGILQFILDEEIDSYENIPDNLKGSCRAEDSEISQDLLENAIDSLEDAISFLNDI